MSIKNRYTNRANDGKQTIFTSFFEKFVSHSLIFARFDSYKSRIATTVAKETTMDVTEMTVANNFL